MGERDCKVSFVILSPDQDICHLDVSILLVISSRRTGGNFFLLS